MHFDIIGRIQYVESIDDDCEDPDVSREYEHIDNITLIRDNLRHVAWELGADQPSGFRIAKEAHQILLRSMVEALKGTANLAITGRVRDKNRRCYYMLGNEPRKMIEKKAVPGCKKAWRYSAPVVSSQPQVTSRGRKRRTKPDDFLLGFYDLLAMIQTECFMSRYTMSAPVVVSDADTKTLEWLHEQVRNEFEHFVPKFYLASTDYCLEAAGICLRLSQEVLFQSRNMFPRHVEGIENQIPDLMAGIRDLRSQSYSADT